MFLPPPPICHWVSPPLSAAPAALSDEPLHCLVLSHRLAAMYPLVFPTHNWQEMPVHLTLEQVANQVETFLRQVNEHLFPVETEVDCCDPDYLEQFLSLIHIQPAGFGYQDGQHYLGDDEDTPDDYDEPIGFLLCLAHEAPATVRAWYPDWDMPAAFNLALLIAPLRQMALPEPLSILPTVIEIVYEQSGNIWLDLSEVFYYSGYHEPLVWEDKTTLEWLHSSWQEAQTILQTIGQLTCWMEQNPQEHLKEIMNLLLRTYIQEVWHGSQPTTTSGQD